jgi:hypothetical protein
VSRGTPQDLTRLFLEPANATHRQYEALRAHFVDGLPPKEVAARFAYTPGSFRVLACRFRKNPHMRFFVEPVRGPDKSAAKRTVHDRIIALRKENLSIYDISEALRAHGDHMTPAGVSLVLKQAGFARLPRRRDDERPGGVRPIRAEAADARKLDLSPRSFRTKFGGLFLFLPFLTRLPLEEILYEAGMPGTDQVPAGHANRALLGLKLFGSARHSHVMSWVLDEGLALFAGLNAIPKRSFLTEYSCRIDPASYPVLMRRWFDAADGLGLRRTRSFDLDFHAIPFHGERALMQKHYVSKRSRRQKGVLAFLAQDAGTRVFCYAHAGVRKEEHNDQILRFVRFWQQRTGTLPDELVFDSQLTTYANLNVLNHKKVRFITLRRRSKRMLEEAERTPVSAWRRVHLDGVTRIYRTPRVLDTRVQLSDYDGPIRQLVIRDLGHEQPTFLLTNQLKIGAARLISRYAQRMLIENSIADGIEFFHMDALSSAVAMKVNWDLQLTLMASSLYRLLGQRVGNGYDTAKSAHIFRDLVDATAAVQIAEQTISVRFQKRAHNPLLVAAGLDKERVRVPWLGGKTLRLVLG